MFQFVRSSINDFFDILFPYQCLGCRQSLSAHEKVLCTNCRINLPETNQHKDPYDQALLNKFAGKVPIQFIASYLYFSKGGVVQKLIHSIKYKGQKEAAKEVAGWYGHQIRLNCERIGEIDVVIGVPLHKDRYEQRGYNQADWIAEGIAEALGTSSRTDVLIRNDFKESQTHKTRLERWENVKAVFSVVNKDAVTGKHIMLVDDVLTTGSTIEACARELLMAGSRSVSVLTLAVAGKE